MVQKQAEFNELIGRGKAIVDYVGREVVKEGSPIIILEGYEWVREVLSLMAKNINLCDDSNNERTKEYYYEYHISKLLQFKNVQKYVTENEERIRNIDAPMIEQSELEEKITQIETILSNEGYNIQKIRSKSIAKLAKEKPELFGVYISMYCEGSEYEHSNRGKIASFREAIVGEYDADAVFKLELGKSDLATWKTVFNFTFLNIFYAVEALYNRINCRDKHLFETGMISEQASAHTLLMIKELTDKLDAYGVED